MHGTQVGPASHIIILFYRHQKRLPCVVTLVRYTNVGTVQVPGTTVTIYLRMYRSVLMKQVSF